MTAPTVRVTATVFDQAGQPIEGATILMALDRSEVYQGFVVPASASGTTDATGQTVLLVFPNALGVNGSQYKVTITTPEKTIRSTAVVPNSDSYLHDIMQTPPYPAISLAQQATNQAQVYAAQAGASSVQAVTATATAVASRDEAQAARDQSLAAQTVAVAARDQAADSASVAQAARDQTVASVGAVKVSVADTTATTLSETLDVSAPMAMTIENPGGNERLALSVSAFSGAASDQAGTAGLVPAPVAGDEARFLRGDATWRSLDAQALGMDLVENVPAVDRRVGESKGDLVAFSAAGTPARLPAGADGQMLVADSAQACGLRYVPPSAGAWTVFEALPTRTADATFTVADTVANQGIFAPGRPIRFRQNSAAAWQYAMVTTYAAGTVTIAGAPYTAAIGADAGRQMQYGDMARLVQETFAFAGRFAAVATTQALQDLLLLQYVWTRGAAHCVGFRVRPLVDDSGSAQPHVNVKCNGNLVGTANSNAGLAVSDAAWTATTTDISTANAAITFGQALEVVVDAAGTNDDARDLTLIVSFVLE